MHKKTERAHRELVWLGKVLEAASVRNSTAFVRVKDAPPNQVQQLLAGNATKSALTQKGNSSPVPVFICLATAMDSDTREVTLELPTTLERLHKWVVPEIGIMGIGKTFFFSRTNKAHRKLIVALWRGLQHQISKGASSTSPGHTSDAGKTIEGLKLLIADLVAQLHMSREALVDAQQERDLFRRERKMFLAERDAAIAALKKMQRTGPTLVRNRK